MPKAFVHLHGQPLLRHALDRVLAVSGVGHVVVVAPAAYVGPAHVVVADASAAGRASAALWAHEVAGGAWWRAWVSRGLAAPTPPRDTRLVDGPGPAPPPPR